MKSFLIVIKFFTVLPVGKNLEIKDKELAKSAIYFPLVGALIGLLLVAVDFIFRKFFPGFIVNIFVLMALAITTGGIHLDGFIDSADGLFSGRDKKRILEIMRDSRIGAFGVLAVIFLILLKLSFLNEIAIDIRYSVLIMMPLVSRWAVVYLAQKYPYARDTAGSGGFLAKLVRKKELIIATVFTAILVVFLMHLAGVIIWLAAFLVLLILGRWINKKIGGMTGDTYGALIETAEVIILILAYLINSI